MHPNSAMQGQSQDLTDGSASSNKNRLREHVLVHLKFLQHPHLLVSHAPFLCMHTLTGASSTSKTVNKCSKLPEN